MKTNTIRNRVTKSAKPALIMCPWITSKCNSSMNLYFIQLGHVFTKFLTMQFFNKLVFIRIWVQIYFLHAILISPWHGNNILWVQILLKTYARQTRHNTYLARLIQKTLYCLMKHSMYERDKTQYPTKTLRTWEDIKSVAGSFQK